MSARVTSDEFAKIAAELRAGTAIKQISRLYGRSPTAIKRVASEAGISLPEAPQQSRAERKLNAPWGTLPGEYR